jgi:hypothetical protein
MTTTSPSASGGMTGWSLFAAIWLVVAGAFNVVDGLTVIHRSNLISDQLFLFSSSTFWGWVLLIVGIVQLVAGFMVFSGNPSGNMLGICVAAFALFIWFFFVFVAPVGALIALVINGMVIYGLSLGSARGEY